MRLRERVVAALAAVVIGSGVFVTGAAAAEGSAGVGADVLSNYVWRGQKLSDDHGVVQPWVDFSLGGFGANYWANYDLENSEHTETDLTLSYSTEMDRLGVTVGYINYALDGASDTQEVFVEAGYDTVLSPTVAVYYDFDEGEGAFAVLSVGHSVDLAGGAALNLAASASVNFGNLVMGVDSSGDEFTNLYNGEVSVSVSVPFGEYVTVEPKVAWSFPLSDEAEAAIESLSFDNDGSTVYGGVALSAGF